MNQFICAALGSVIAVFSNGEEMKLVNTKTGFIVVEIKGGKAEFYDRFLEVEMKENGILIPPGMAKDFDGEKVIFLGDPLFEKAFIEIYYPLCIANQLYQWQ